MCPSSDLLVLSFFSDERITYFGKDVAALFADPDFLNNYKGMLGCLFGSFV